MLFSGEEVFKKVNVLSGGEKARCMLSKCMLEAPNFLILDEPTNHLDLESITSLNNGLIDYKESMLFVSHDHQFIQTIANRIIELTPTGTIDKIMTYDEYLEEMREEGAFVVKSNNGSENKADVDIMTQELNQSQTQIAKQDLWDNALSISAIPNREGNTGGDTAGAVSLRNGWDFSKQRAKLKDPYIQAAEKQLDLAILNVIRQEKGPEECALGTMDFDVQISHSPTDNMLTKAQALQILLQSGIHPLIAIKTVGLWADAEKVFLQSKEYLDKVYSTVEDDLGKEEATKQEAKAQDIYKATKEVLSNGTANNR